MADASALDLSVEDDEVLVFDKEDNEQEDDKLSLCLICKLLSSKPFDLDALKRTMIMEWSLQEDVLIRSIGSNVFLFQLFHWKDKEKVLEGRPWCFEQRLLALQDIDNNVQPSDVISGFSPFWLRLYNLPFGSRSKDCVREIFASFGEVLEVKDDLLDIEPHKRKIRVKDESIVTIAVKYERLPHFCLLSGRIDHTDRDCVWVAEEDQDKGCG
ncbi:uncharacterized protein LOC130808266 [Amaranthus tricolor]|uniref:uncharacterized protein LOC130808266 n=1 Tax=Amaranthus tricolor TaxID=29722 RepID=UPI0025895C17|nr:uncharacterized protein LOC130808266 [Amaranthus tricolor]